MQTRAEYKGSAGYNRNTTLMNSDGYNKLIMLIVVRKVSGQ